MPTKTADIDEDRTTRSQIALRAPRRTLDQIDGLVERWGPGTTKTLVISIAVDRLYREEVDPPPVTSYILLTPDTDRKALDAARAAGAELYVDGSDVCASLGSKSHPSVVRIERCETPYDALRRLEELRG